MKLAAAVLALLALTACAAESDPNTESTSDSLHVERITVDGREITCVTYKAYSAGGLSCDWSGR